MSRIHAAARRSSEPIPADDAPVDRLSGAEAAAPLRPWGQAPPSVDETLPRSPRPNVVTPRLPLDEVPMEVMSTPTVPEFGQTLAIAPNLKVFCVEQYRKLAATLHQAQLERGIKVILIASALPGEGKTLTAVNLALTLSESYRRRVLLIDADLRHPTIHTVFRAPNTAGLHEALTSASDRPVPIIRAGGDLSLLTAGAPQADPMRALTSPRMSRLVQDAASRFDWVILDTPPVALLPDAKLLTAMADAVLLVIRAASTPHRPIQRTIEAIGRDRVIGVVLNRVDERIVTEARFGNYYGELVNA
jgi:protein-tyrosine kinase